MARVFGIVLVFAAVVFAAVAIVGWSKGTTGTWSINHGLFLVLAVACAATGIVLLLRLGMEAPH